ncbi:MAG TPA: hypothetical protein VLB84_15295, partial [Bacteroidia bacterium]|nr:hypothetical protein [Bacteroidia bacterium]
ALRSALGASRWRIVGTLFAESIIITFFSCFDYCLIDDKFERIGKIHSQCLLTLRLFYLATYKFHLYKRKGQILIKIKMLTQIA